MYALPYSNGPIHLGHMLEHIQSDIYVRFNRAIGNKVFYVCGDDCHGTPVMIKANSLGITPEQMIEITSKDHDEDLKGFLVQYDNYYRTHSKENEEISAYMYKKAKENGYILTKTISQLFDPEKNMFLPDRFVKAHVQNAVQKISTVTTARFAVQHIHLLSLRMHIQLFQVLNQF